MRAVENALGIEIPDNARIIRNLIAGIQYVQDHVVHFYHLHALDWVDITSALQADPAETSKLAQSLSPWAKSSAVYFKSVKDRLKKFVDSGQLGLFANGYWGHPAYKLPPAANLMAVAHYLEALDWQREVIRIHAILGSKNPHPQTYLVGGMAIPLDPNSSAALNADKLALQRQLLVQAKQFVDEVYVPDLLAVASFYKEWAGIGAGIGNYLACGDFPLDSSGDPSRLWQPAGVIRNRDLAKIHPFEHQKVTRVRDTLLVRILRQRRRFEAPLGRRDESSLQRPQAALRVPRHRAASTLGSRRRATRTSPWRWGLSRACSSLTLRGTERSRRR